MEARKDRLGSRVEVTPRKIGGAADRQACDAAAPCCGGGAPRRLHGRPRRPHRDSEDLRIPCSDAASASPEVEENRSWLGSSDRIPRWMVLKS